MTTLGRQRLQSLPLAVGFGFFAVLAAGPSLISRAPAATTELVTVDRHSGLALYGFDPVAYFTDSEAKSGSEDLEFRYGGASWRFSNEGNRAAFEKDPDVYMPQFGGYDPVAVSEGVAREGHPEFFIIHHQRLFLFYSAEAKQAFETDPDGHILRADATWPVVSKRLAP